MEPQFPALPSKNNMIAIPKYFSAESQLFPGLINLSFRITSHLILLQQKRVRSSNIC